MEKELDTKEEIETILARQGKARQGKARQGKARQGADSLDKWIIRTEHLSVRIGFMTEDIAVLQLQLAQAAIFNQR